MKWYSAPPGYDDNSTYCYCDLIIQPNDIILQDKLPFSIPSSGYNFDINAYSPDGSTNIGNFTSGFDYFFATDPSGNAYFSARLNNFPPALCAQCFILRVSIRKFGAVLYTYDMYTNVFCIDNCCTVSSGVRITEGGTSIPVATAGNAISGTGTTPVQISDSCGLPIMRIEAQFACKDVFSGQYYGDPGTVTGGNYSGGYRLRKVLNIRGTFRRLPRTIDKQISLNSRTQKVSSVRKWELQSSEQFPDWKMDDIEDMFCAPHIYVNTVEYVYPGDTPFRMLFPKERNSTYGLKTVLQETNKWQIFGCSDDCTTVSERYYGLLRQASSYYSESGMLIGYTYDNLLAYFNSIDGSTGTFDVTDATIPGGYYKIFKVSGTGIIPAFFYTDSISLGNRIYGKDLDAATGDYTQLFALSSCQRPVIGEITFTTNTCQDPVLGEITFTSGVIATGAVIAYGEWAPTDATNQISRVDYQCKLTCTLQNSHIPDDGSSQVYINGEIIGTIPNELVPSVQQIINHSMNSTVPDGSYLLINTNGTIQWYGLPSTPDHSVATISVTDINYTL